MKYTSNVNVGITPLFKPVCMEFDRNFKTKSGMFSIAIIYFVVNFLLHQWSATMNELSGILCQTP